MWLLLKYKIYQALWLVIGRPCLPPRSFKPRSYYDKCEAKNAYKPQSLAIAEAYVKGLDIETIARHADRHESYVVACLWKEFKRAHNVRANS